LAEIDNSIEFVVADKYHQNNFDAVIIERIYREDVDTEELQEIVHHFRKNKTRVIYTIDDNLYDLFMEGCDHIKDARLLSAVCFLTRTADGVICSTDELAHIVREINQNTYIFPNYLTKRIVPDLRQEIGSRQDRTTITIGCMGTLTHLNDFRIVANAIKEIMFDYEGVSLEVLGLADPKDLREAMKFYDPLIRQPPTYEYDVFFPWFVDNMRWDICLAPLADNPLNRCKSDLKFLDYSAIGGAGVYSNLTPYEHLGDRGLGLVVENTDDAWYSAIEKLINDPDLRTEIQFKAHAYLQEQRLLEDNIHKLRKIINLICS